VRPNAACNTRKVATTLEILMKPATNFISLMTRQRMLICCEERPEERFSRIGLSTMTLIDVSSWANENIT